MRHLSIILAAVTLLAGCSKEPLPPPEPVPAERVFLMYDNIDDYRDKPFSGNVKMAGTAVAAGALGPGERVVVFHRGCRVEEYEGVRSVIYELVKDSSQPEGYRKEMLRVYDSGVNATFSTEVIAAVVGEIRTAIPADHYGFAFGSHGRGWIPKSNNYSISRHGGSPQTARHPFAELWEVPENPLTRYFLGYGQELDISEFIDALDEWTWDFILLDDCFMASAEALYEMRTLTGYFIASPTEIMMAGFPYDRVVSILFQGWENNLEKSLADVADGYVEAYRADLVSPGYPYATIAVVKTAELDALAESVRRLGLKLNEVTSTTGIQYYERYSRPGHIFYDLDDYLGTIRAGDKPTEYNSFRSQLARTVIFADHTEYFFSAPLLNSGTVRVDHYSGLNVFIPWSQTTPFIADYQQTEWYKYVYAQ